MSAQTSGAGNAELREFLRTRRARITPEQAGLSTQPGRRVPGLRREEVARLAGVSVDYYVRLERGRPLNPSDSVLDALARALALTDVEREHLFTVARPAHARRQSLPSQQVRPGVRRVLDSMPDVPALVLGRRMDVLAANPLARAFYTDFDVVPERERNMARYAFLDESVRDFYDDWVSAARGLVASLRLYAGSHPDDPELVELVADLSARDPDFRRWWADHDVFRRTYGSKLYHHPTVGDITLGYEAFAVSDDPEQHLGVATVEPGSPSEQALQRLKILSGT
jgi:transcriptional regulator with XRE-family HTH domain